jgi:thiol-disulfide isomerase/thioredoxin
MLLAAGCATAPAARAPVTHSLPSVSLRTLDDQPAQLEKVLAGRVGLISLWATWCEACRDELDALSRLADRAGPRGATVVAIAVGEKRAQVQAFVHEHPLRAVQLVDEDYRLADALGARRVPTTLVVDGAGQILYVGGALDDTALAALRSAIEHRVATR